MKIKIIRAIDIIEIKESDFCNYTKEIQNKGYHLKQVTEGPFVENSNDTIFLLCYW